MLGPGRKTHDKLSSVSRQIVKLMDKMSCRERGAKRRILFLTIKSTKYMKTNETGTKCHPNIRPF